MTFIGCSCSVLNREAMAHQTSNLKKNPDFIFFYFPMNLLTKIFYKKGLKTPFCKVFLFIIKT